MRDAHPGQGATLLAVFTQTKQLLSIIICTFSPFLDSFSPCYLFFFLKFWYFVIFLTLFQIKESFAEPPECHDLKILAETFCLQGSGRHVGCVCSTVLRRWCYLLAWFTHVSEQMGKEQWKAPVSGYSRWIFAVYFVPENWTRGR